jgi:hypothetical protein
VFFLAFTVLIHIVNGGGQNLKTYIKRETITLGGGGGGVMSVTVTAVTVMTAVTVILR